MSEFKLELRFDNDDLPEEAGQEWLSKVLKAMPLGTTGKLIREDRVLEVEKLGPQHEGYQIVIDRGSAETNLKGKLDSVFPGTPSKIVVIDGRAYPVKNYELATLTEA